MLLQFVTLCFLLQMAISGELTSLGELLNERAGTEEEEDILEKIKELAQEHLPVGWTTWEVTKVTKEDIFGARVEAKVLNKLVFALPTVGIVRAFMPDADHLSEKRYREIRLKLVDWAFTRALILSPPAIANKIRGSAVRTELFKQSVEVVLPLLHTRAEADRILSGNLSEGQETGRKRRGGSSSREPSSQRRRVRTPSPSTSQDLRFEALDKKIDNMFSILLGKINQRQNESDSDKENEGDTDWEDESVSADDSWQAPALGASMDLQFLPSTKEADPPVPEPSSQIRKEGIECQRLGTDGWSRIRYKDVEKYLQAASPFSPLRVNNELAGLLPQPAVALTKTERILGTITHGLLLQRKALAEGLNNVITKCPAAGEGLRELIAEDSKFRVLSDQLLQFVCAHRAETLDQRRKSFRAKNEVLNATLQAIPPSPSHLFEEKALSTFVKDNGGQALFVSTRFAEKKSSNFRKPAPPVKEKTKTAERRRPSAQYSAARYVAGFKSAANNGQRKRKDGGDKKKKFQQRRN